MTRTRCLAWDRGALSIQWGSILGQVTVKTACGRRARLSTVTGDPEQSDCPACRAEAAREDAGRAEALLMSREFTIDASPERWLLVSLLAANDNDPALRDALVPLAVGESATYGGGAAASFLLTRVS